MGRLIVFDNFVEDKLNAIFRNKCCQSGLIIGQCTDQKDIAIRLCSTPTKDDEHASTVGDSDKTKKSKTNVPNIDEQWICQHAKQLIRSLPGGLDILGFYVVAPSEFTTKNQSLLRQVLFSIFKILGKNRSFNLCSSERVLLNICPVTMKTVCRTYDISDYKSSANPAEWKLQSGPMKWHRIRCRLAVDIKFPIKSEDAGLSLQKQIEIGLHPFLENVKEAHAICNGSQRELGEPLDNSNEGKKSKKKSLHESDSSSAPSKWHDIELFIPLETNNNISSPEVCECICMMTFKGAVQCRAYVHSKATVQEAINALKQDIMRSITARFEIHCEDLLLIEEEQQDPVVVHELPRRVFAPLPQADVCVCDYQFHSDTAVDSLDAFKELLNLELSEQDIDTSCEVSPTTSTLILPDAVEERLSEFGDTPTHSSMNKVFIPIAGIALAVSLAGLSFFLNSNS